jgi:kynurenine formamidase
MKRKFFLNAAVAAAVGLIPALTISGQPAAQLEYPRPHTRTGDPWTPNSTRPNPVAYKPHPLTQDPKRRITPEDIRRYEKELSNWGRWGANDTRGALNLITPAKTAAAARLVTEGVSVNLQHFVEFTPSVDNWRFWPAEKWLTSATPQTGEQGYGPALDAVRFSTHEGTLSHLDAICHYDRRSPMADIDPDYRVTFNNHRNRRDELSCQGESGILGMGPGYVTRGVLVDIPLLRNVKWLEPTTPIFVDELEKWEQFAGVKIGPGDALLVRTGRWAKRAAEGPWQYDQGGAGLHASVLPWLHARGVSLLVGDAVSDVQPSGVEGSGRPVHTISMVAMGLPLVDNGYLEDVAREAARFKRWQFMVSWQINQSKGGTAVPFNGIATF